MADVLFGTVNPGGKLPVTIARSVGQLPMFYNAKPSARRGYLFDTTEPLFPFGFGLSYTRFEIGAPRLSRRRASRRTARSRSPSTCATSARAPETRSCSCTYATRSHR